jgi:uncharacterized protein YpmS
MQKRLLAFLIILVVASLACSLPGKQAKDTPTPVPTATRAPEASTADAQEFQSQISTASAQFSETGTLSLTFSEQQITTFLTDILAKQTDVPISDPQITLDNDQMTISGKATVGGLSSQATIVVKPYVESGVLKANVVSANFGKLPIPQGLLTQLTDSINSNLNEFITVQGRQVEIESIQISGGKMTVTGKAR